MVRRTVDCCIPALRYVNPLFARDIDLSADKRQLSTESST
jgi:hypothetical protein